MSVYDVDDTGVARLEYFPTKKQAEANWLFQLKAEGMKALPRYTLTVDCTGVHFLKRVGKDVADITIE